MSRESRVKKALCVYQVFWQGCRSASVKDYPKRRMRLTLGVKCLGAGGGIAAKEEWVGSAPVRHSLTGQRAAEPHGNIQTSTRDLQHQTPDSPTRDSQLETQDSGLTTRDSQLETQDSGLTTRGSQLETQDSGLTTRGSQLETQDSGLTTRDSQLETRDLRLGTQDTSLTRWRAVT